MILHVSEVSNQGSHPEGRGWDWGLGPQPCSSSFAYNILSYLSQGSLCRHLTTGHFQDRVRTASESLQTSFSASRGFRHWSDSNL